MTASTVVFTGPSLSAAAVAAALPGAAVAPPARRGDVRRACAEGARTILLIDGVFAHAYAVSPGEIVAALRSGVRVLGAASLGAVRAAECHPAGMEGVGAIHRLFRLGVLGGDDEVAVAVEPDADHRSASDALVTIRFAVLAALRARRLDRAAGARVLELARATHFSERRWVRLLDTAGVPADRALHELARVSDPKRRDAEQAVARLAAEPAGPRPGSEAPAAPRLPPVAPAHRPGHEPLLGMTAEESRAALYRWLRASGRARRLTQTPWADPAAAWAALETAAELEGELLRLHAVRVGAALCSGAEGPAPGPWLVAARREIAEAHGAADWRSLEAQLRERRSGGQALADLRRAASALALARRNLAGPGEPRGTP